MTLLKVRDVADRLGLSRSTVLRYHQQGILPGFRLPGGALRFREDELDAWLEGRRTLTKSVNHSMVVDMGQDRVEYTAKLNAFVAAADRVAELLDDYTPIGDDECEEAEALRQFERLRLALLQSSPA